MQILQDFQVTARKNSFVDFGKAEDGAVLWRKKPTANAEDRLCVDSLTNSATIFWTSILWKINSKTFRAASALHDWFAFNAEQPAPAPKV
jgi:hypothetical protein